MQSMPAQIQSAEPLLLAAARDFVRDLRLGPIPSTLNQIQGWLNTLQEKLIDLKAHGHVGETLSPRLVLEMVKIATSSNYPCEHWLSDALPRASNLIESFGSKQMTIYYVEDLCLSLLRSITRGSGVWELEDWENHMTALDSAIDPVGWDLDKIIDILKNKPDLYNNLTVGDLEALRHRMISGTYHRQREAFITQLISAIDHRIEGLKNPNLKSCDNCRRREENMSKCAKCKKVYYCCRECQRVDWPAHKHRCSPN